MCANYPRINWNKKNNIKICGQELTSSTTANQDESGREMFKNEKCTYKACKSADFFFFIVKYANVWRSCRRRRRRRRRRRGSLSSLISLRAFVISL